MQTRTRDAGGAWVRLADVRKPFPPGACSSIRRVFPSSTTTRPGEIIWTKPPHYVAWVIPAANAGDVRMVDLGEAAPIDAAVAKSRLAILAYR